MATLRRRLVLLVALAFIATLALIVFVVRPAVIDRADRRACVINGGAVEPDPDTVWVCVTPLDYP